ncbi:RcnB family protein [Caballeronia sp. LZ062]|uniref:RcnB family protein n=1 Tax=unclassified Caballeronia TaxID=2646786 RepID=UPI0028607ED7|nr:MULTISPECIES: RcnB family protein [unclassified Caballeronia]MDR5856892.1 RcnB family protein [Caballeronia sp. LZ050]MDR5869711.1 RcnB family protein [Caballeronia sp. LZ062]
MKKGILVALLSATLGLSAGASFAQPSHGPDRDHGPDGHHAPMMHGHDEPRPPEQAGRDRGHPDWHKGDRLSSEYRDHQYVVDDWRGHGLRQPPRGYQWVGVGADYVLVAAATGLIAQVVLAQ